MSAPLPDDGIVGVLLPIDAVPAHWPHDACLFKTYASVADVERDFGAKR